MLDLWEAERRTRPMVPKPRRVTSGPCFPVKNDYQHCSRLSQCAFNAVPSLAVGNLGPAWPPVALPMTS